MKNTRRWIKIITMFVLSMIILLQEVPVMAATEGTDWKTVRVSCGINKSLYLNEQGQPEGFCADYLQKLAEINHWKLEYVANSWNDSVQSLYDGKIDLLFPTQMTEDRVGKMGFSTAIGGYQPIGLYARADAKLCYEDYKGFDGLKIALSAGTSNEMALQEYSKTNQFTYEAVYFNTTQEKMDALNDGAVDMIVFSTLNDVPNAKVVAMIDYLPFYYCTNIENTELLEELNYGMNQMIIRYPNLVESVFYSFMNKNISFAYTVQEEKEIKENGTISVGIYKDTAPLFSIDKDGNMKGIYLDLIERISDISGLTINIVPLERDILPFERLDSGEVDFILGSSDQALKYADERGYVQSEGIMDYYTAAVTKNDYSPDKDDDLTFALTYGRKYWESNIQKEYPNAAFIYYLDSKECLEAVQSGKADIALTNTWEFNYHSKNDRFENLMEWESSRVLSQTVFISKESENAVIRTIMNKAIEQISNAEKESIISANLSGVYADYNSTDHLYAMREYLVIFGFIIIIIIAVFSVYIVMRKRTMDILRKNNQKLADVNAAKDRFMSRMSHELRTPLNAITGYATVTTQSAEAHEIEEKNIVENMNSIQRAARYQLAIIGDLLDFQKIDAGKLELQKAEVDSVECLKTIINIIRIDAEEKKIHFSFEQLTDGDDTYVLDAVRFQQVLLNILHNAIKFTPEGGTVKMTFEVIDFGPEANTVKFVISDTGIGMSEDFQKNYLFHRFAQEYSGNTSPYEGCGTGLAISKDIMHLMGGEIKCQSKLGEGSTFTIIATIDHLTHARKKREHRPQIQYDLSGIRVLLCEDNEMNQDMEKRLLERMKCEVDVAADGQIGLSMFKNSESKHYSIILMDIRMPNMDGLEATRTIRSLDREDAKTIPIVAVSANAFEEDIKASIESGMNEHLAKPVGARILYEKIAKYCNE